MAKAKVRVGDKNTDFQLVVQETNVAGTNVIVDLSTGVTSKEIIIVDPDGNESGPFTATFVTDGTDGIINYVQTDANLIDEPGVWSYKAKIVFTTTAINESNDAFFEVLP